MRAHFAGDVVLAEAPIDAGDDSIYKIEAEEEPLDARIDDFKQDSKNMEVVSEFIEDVLQKAETEAVKQQAAKNDKASQQPKEKIRQSFTIPDFKNGKMVNRARGLVVRIFDAICNCANTAAGPAQRIKLRAKRAASSATAPVSMENGSEGKKQDAKVKEKKSDKKHKDGSGAAAKTAKVEVNGEETNASLDTLAEDGIKEAEADEADMRQETEVDKQ